MKQLSFVLMAFVLSTLCSCTQSQRNQMQQEALEAEPEILNADELAKVLGSDTTHFKAVYFFSDICKPCQEHLRNEMRKLYRSCDTNVWRIYLVAEFNGLSRIVRDADGNIVEASIDDKIRYFSEQYRTKLTELGYDMADVCFFFDERWDLDQGVDQSTVVKKAFSSDHEFEVSNGVPLFLVADPHNHIKTIFTVSREVERVTDGIPELGPITTAYEPVCSYSLETFDYTKHDTAFSVGSHFHYDNSKLPPIEEIFKGWIRSK